MSIQFVTSLNSFSADHHGSFIPEDILFWHLSFSDIPTLALLSNDMLNRLYTITKNIHWNLLISDANSCFFLLLFWQLWFIPFQYQCFFSLFFHSFLFIILLIYLSCKNYNAFSRTPKMRTLENRLERLNYTGYWLQVHHLRIFMAKGNKLHHIILLGSLTLFNSI